MLKSRMSTRSGERALSVVALRDRSQSGLAPYSDPDVRPVRAAHNLRAGRPGRGLVRVHRVWPIRLTPSAEQLRRSDPEGRRRVAILQRVAGRRREGASATSLPDTRRPYSTGRRNRSRHGCRSCGRVRPRPRPRCGSGTRRRCERARSPVPPGRSSRTNASPTIASVHVLPAGSVRLHVSKLMSSVPKNRRITAAAAPPSTLCAESWSGIGGVVTNGVQVGSASVTGLPSVAASWIAVTGRQKL